MAEIFECDFVNGVIRGTTPISSENKEEFVKQYRSSLEETKEIQGVVYIFRTEKLVPRLKGFSNILYIGRTKYAVWDRYIVKKDTDTFWDVYYHIVKNFGSIFIDVYRTSNMKATEKTFLIQYLQEHKELPPINRKQ